jgi:hypothetical protein
MLVRSYTQFPDKQSGEAQTGDLSQTSSFLLSLQIGIEKYSSARHLDMHRGMRKQQTFSIRIGRMVVFLFQLGIDMIATARLLRSEQVGRIFSSRQFDQVC